MRVTTKVKRLEQDCQITTNCGKEGLEFCMFHVCYIAVCDNCHQRYHQHQRGTKTCSNECRQALYRKRQRILFVPDNKEYHK